MQVLGSKPVGMFIRAFEHKARKSRRKYRTYKPVESVRTERGARQIRVLNPGADFNLPKEQREVAFSYDQQ